MGQGDYLADAWEKEEIAYIIERELIISAPHMTKAIFRYVKLKATIDSWETKKKKKEKHKIERAQAELDKRRAKYIKSYNDKITRIEVIARRAREQADEDKKQEEFEVKEKANKIRLTGKIPATCFCF
ncbi:remorin family protein [Striga asiatica]|uniref:Remorin family protein n=1 Tax=Striga asiatica TaxID=4170 RepID=A0A5A7PGE8_STRAF|nr:remorin family protein [Striga asiatica]